MKILIVSQYYFPEQFQINEIAPELVRRGHEVTVLCGIPNYPKGEIFAGYTDPSKMRETLNGVRIVRVRQRPRGHNIVTLLLNYISFVRTANRQTELLDKDFDVVIGYQLSPVTSMLPAVKYAKLTNTPLLFYVLDLWPVSGQSHLPVKRGLMFWWLSRISRKIYCAADRILVTSRPFIKYLERNNGVDIRKMGYLPQHADSAMLSMDLEKQEDGIVSFVYAGNLGAASALDVIVKAAAILGKRSDYVIHFVGDGSRRSWLESSVQNAGLTSQFVFHGNQTRDRMPNFYKMADALLLTLRGDNEVGDTMPGKLQMYMTTGKPILGAINGAANDVITESECGKCVSAGDYEGLAGLMSDFINNRDAYRCCGKKAKAFFVKNFTLDKYISELETELSELKKG